jgi:hypothetical protein
MSQMAESIMGAISLNPGSAEAKNITRTAIKLGTEIVNSFNQRCGSRLDTKQTVRVEGNNNVIEFISFKQAAALIRNCVQTSSAVTTVANDIQAQIDQTAKAEKKGIDLNFLVIIIVGIVLVFGAGGTKVVTSPAFIGGVVVLVGIWLGVAWATSRFPFQKKKPPPDDDDEPNPKKFDPDDEEPEESFFLAHGRRRM